MLPARGDRKPCTARECTGTMQYGRQSDSRVPTGRDGSRQLTAPQRDPKGWVCDGHPEHFREGV
jgi:hypothetical protein